MLYKNISPNRHFWMKPEVLHSFLFPDALSWAHLTLEATLYYCFAQD